ncbi:hypothetical protein [Pseudochryseolinea flava]|uniref:Uncharacterized protein n=1 Tax=Pseudochryseolinea flava TaxID=2059302 RepID=A0A364Y3A4_9BACT|nr:hypothetical protein [Pseudochryseolinea flava]RAW00489.1 hypothetical protein DQQ10_12860 [Pseudochryseolinea flava]
MGQVITERVGQTVAKYSPEWHGDKEIDSINDETNKLIGEYLAKTFSQSVPANKKELYKLTIAIADKHKSIDPAMLQFDGLMYPTVQMWANAENFALERSVIDSGKMYLNAVEWILVKRVHNGKYDIDVLDWANSVTSKGEIEWKGRLPRWNVNELEVNSVYWDDYYGKKVLKDRHGNIIEPI